MAVGFFRTERVAGSSTGRGRGHGDGRSGGSSVTSTGAAVGARPSRRRVLDRRVGGSTTDGAMASGAVVGVWPAQRTGAVAGARPAWHWPDVLARARPA
jgi:hypothetical protein